MNDLDKLIKILTKTHRWAAKKVALLALDYSKDVGTIKIASDLLNEAIVIDLWELESLINSEKFEYPDSEIDEIGVKLND